MKYVSLKTFKTFLRHKGLTHIRTSGGHEIWTKPELTRPVVIQSTKDPVPMHVINNTLRTIICSKKEFDVYMNKH